MRCTCEISACWQGGGGSQRNFNKLLYITSLYSALYTGQRNNCRTTHSENGQVPPVSVGTWPFSLCEIFIQNTSFHIYFFDCFSCNKTVLCIRFSLLTLPSCCRAAPFNILSTPFCQAPINEFNRLTMPASSAYIHTYTLPNTCQQCTSSGTSSTSSTSIVPTPALPTCSGGSPARVGSLILKHLS